MKLVAKKYKNIESNDNNIFCSDILYIDTVSLIGFGAKRNKDSDVFGYIYIDIAVMLEDARSIIKMVLMYEVDKQEFDAFVPTALSMPDRGITGYCPVMVVCSDSFVKDKNEYYVYAINGRTHDDNHVYCMSFDLINMIKFQYYINLVKECIYKGRSITYENTDYYEIQNSTNTKIINLAFTNQFKPIGYVVPPKKMFEKKVKCLSLTSFIHNRNEYFVYYYTTLNSKDRKIIKHSPYVSNFELYNRTCEDKSYILTDYIDIEYYNKGANEVTNKVAMFADRRDKNDVLCLLFPVDNFKTFYNTMQDYMTGN